jgi:hypothetical protein
MRYKEPLMMEKPKHGYLPPKAFEPEPNQVMLTPKGHSMGQGIDLGLVKGDLQYYCGFVVILFLGLLTLISLSSNYMLSS